MKMWDYQYFLLSLVWGLIIHWQLVLHIPTDLFPGWNLLEESIGRKSILSFLPHWLPVFQNLNFIRLFKISMHETKLPCQTWAAQTTSADPNLVSWRITHSSSSELLLECQPKPENKNLKLSRTFQGPIQDFSGIHKKKFFLPSLLEI